jgi:hypothetical protein
LEAPRSNPRTRSLNATRAVRKTIGISRILTTYESFGHLPAGSPRQIDIERDHIRPLFFRERHSGRPVYGLDDP